MIKIKELHVKDNFKYLWLKGVNNVDLTNHCARSLIGKYSEVVKNTLLDLYDTEIDIPKSKAYYLCGVTEPFRYNDNFHLAFKEKDGAVLKVERNGIVIELENAEEITFSMDDIDWALPEARLKQFSTCRNWQFANKFKKQENQK